MKKINRVKGRRTIEGESKLKILILILQHPKIQANEIRQKLNLVEVNYHLRKLKNENLIKCINQGRQTKYEIPSNHGIKYFKRVIEEFRGLILNVYQKEELYIDILSKSCAKGLKKSEIKEINNYSIILLGKNCLNEGHRFIGEFKGKYRELFQILSNEINFLIYSTPNTDNFNLIQLDAVYTLLPLMKKRLNKRDKFIVNMFRIMLESNLKENFVYQHMEKK